MYAETGLIFPNFQTFSPDVQQFYDLAYSHKSNACLGSLVESCNISAYDLGGEGDLFKAPEPIIDQPVITVDPMTAAMAVISCGENELSPQELNDEFLSNVFHEYKEMLEKDVETETSPLSEVLNYKLTVKTDESSIVKEHVHPPGQISKSMSSGCLSSMNLVQEAQTNPGFLEVDFENVYGMRRAFSDGDIKTLTNENGNHRRLSVAQPQLMSGDIIEDRWQKLSRYRNKKSKRNFGRKIKYACRKALADSQPRIRGRFAKTEESEIWKK
ncbi:putative transcription factor C2C2-CO-like family [Helianthus annuus]|uniref:Putative CCT domain-containing protein n=1 Tax=Helianthus annuus TaxID=4232 RepID=A0A251SP53_HELAN|nr:zinc finger protein CONSTANS-LIKE 12 [Helianthus annuus]KAF5772255.1 putative transcription factor C2C2-CO-like family [Helianthus annuus]KAJ0475887.1 putative transcription factor C2C2-CO-like family [Helianthus annuus]KAJ0479909.1 putative transcription factor C2C2-CO-like family [Helianthus annuus]KAJ0496685.1 putative transcription factor C2C2-CO-like family [Helianthus annuus]KAJ0629376.1 putative transcription factor C2C2-CO-like family [Helianthus annuus]